VGSTLVALNARTGARYPDFGVEGDSTHSCGDATADIANFVEGSVTTNFGNSNLWENCIVGKGRTTHVMKDRLTF
jgi:hypothetical protein